MKVVLSFYVNLLINLAISQSILITVFTSWILCLWGGVRCCQHIPASVINNVNVTIKMYSIGKYGTSSSAWKYFQFYLQSLSAPLSLISSYSQRQFYTYFYYILCGHFWTKNVNGISISPSLVFSPFSFTYQLIQT
jgi:hypothetical protein